MRPCGSCVPVPRLGRCPTPWTDCRQTVPVPGATVPSRPSMMPLSDIGADQLADVGGKALNLAELLRGGYRIPPGFCLTTHAYERVADQAGLGRRLDELAATSADDDRPLGRLAARVAGLVLVAPVPDEVARQSPRRTGAGSSRPGGGALLGHRRGPAVRQLRGPAGHLPRRGRRDDVIDAVRRCWASLWTDRAVAYRAAAGHRPARGAPRRRRAADGGRRGRRRAVHRRPGHRPAARSRHRRQPRPRRGGGVRRRQPRPLRRRHRHRRGARAAARRQAVWPSGRVPAGARARRGARRRTGPAVPDRRAAARAGRARGTGSSSTSARRRTSSGPSTPTARRG